MGGKAFAKTTPTIRLDQESYTAFAAKFHRYLHKLLLAQGRELYEMLIRADSPKWIRSKPDFGDIDVIVGCRDQQMFEQLSEDIATYFKATCVNNGPSSSLAMPLDLGRNRTGPVDPSSTPPLFQVDLIYAEPNWFDFCWSYHSWNDLGNLLGRVAHRLGFKFGHNGLRYIMRNDTHVISDRVVTLDFNEALDFLGYDPAVFNKGFDDWPSMFRYIMSSPWVSPDIYLLENRNARSRVRDAKRPSYQQFLQWLKTRTADLPSSFQWSEDLKATIRQRMLREARHRWPSFDENYNAVILNNERQTWVKRYFNGTLVGNASGMYGHDLGELMATMRNRFPSGESFDTFVLAAQEHAVPHLLNLVLGPERD